MRLLFLAFLLLFLITTSFNLQAADYQVKVLKVSGPALLMKKGEKRILKNGEMLHAPFFIATTKKSQVILSMSVNVLLFVDSSSQVFVRSGEFSGLRLVTLLKGKVLYKEKDLIYLDRKDVLVNTKNSLTGYFGKKFLISCDENGEEKIEKYEHLGEIKLGEAKEEVKSKGQIATDANWNEFDSLFDESPSKETSKTVKDVRIESKKNSTIKEIDADLDALEKSFNISQEDSGEINDNPLSLLGGKNKSNFRLLNYPIEPRAGIDSTTPHFNFLIEHKNSFAAFNGQMNYQLWLEYGTQKHVYKKVAKNFDDREPKRSYLEINELYYVGSSKNIDLKIGKKVYKLAKSHFMSPADFVTPIDQSDPLNPKDLGNWQFELSHYIGNTTLTFLALPYFRANITPHKSSRWSYDTGEIPVVFEKKYPATKIDNISTLFKIQTILRGWDLYAALYNGKNTSAVFKKDVVMHGHIPNFYYIEEYIDVANFVGGFSTTFGKMEVHGDVVRQIPEKNKGDDYVNYVYGITYTIDDWSRFLFLDSINLILEKGGEKMKRPQSAPFYLATSGIARFLHDSFVASITAKVNDRVSFGYDLYRDRFYRSRFDNYSFNYYTINGHKLKLSYEQISGSQSSIFGVWEKNDRYVMDLTFNF